jgi:hypothetical protein
MNTGISLRQIYLLRILGYAKAGKCLFDKAINSDSYWPIWGTCLGIKRGIVLLFFNTCKTLRVRSNNLFLPYLLIFMNLVNIIDVLTF